MKEHWEVKLKKVLDENDGIFGHNVEVDIKRYLRRIEKLSSPVMTPGFGPRLDMCACEIDIIDYYTVKIKLPDMEWLREDVLMHILTTAPMPNECRFNKKKDELTLEWHY